MRLLAFSSNEPTWDNFPKDFDDLPGRIVLVAVQLAQAGIKALVSNKG